MAQLTTAPATFIDTNVLVYAHDTSEPERHGIAQAVLDHLWETDSGVLSTQVLQEFYSVATRKLVQPMTPAEAREVVALYSVWRVVRIEPAMILNASHLQERHGLAFWDALVVESARVGGADRLLTEDMQTGRTFDGVLIENPFSTSVGAAGPA